MPSGITKTDGLMYTGEMPWHKQGVALDNPATAEEAIQAAQLDWKVITEPVYKVNGQQIPNKVAVIREDTETVFNVMSDSYIPVQNTDCFSFFDDVVAQGEAVYHTAGSLYGGKRIFILAKLPEDIKIIPDDVVQPYILLSNSHDGSKALRMQITPIRVVCWNTLTSALNRRGGFYAKHTKNVLGKATEAREMLDLTHQYYEIFSNQIDEWVHTNITRPDVETYFKQVWKFNPDKSYEDQGPRIRKSYENTLALLDHPTNTIGGIAGTKWAAFNAVTYYIDHEKSVRGQDYKDDRRLDSTWFGTGAGLRERAYDLLKV